MCHAPQGEVKPGQLNLHSSQSKVFWLYSIRLIKPNSAKVAAIAKMGFPGLDVHLEKISQIMLISHLAEVLEPLSIIKKDSAF